MADREAMTEGWPVERLTRREHEILGLLAQGYSAPEIAQQLTLAVSSVKSHIQHIYGKLGVTGKRQALTRAAELGLLGGRLTGPALGPQPDTPAAPPAGPKHNFPIPLNSFVGRGTELAEIKRLITTARLVTLTGPGGTGKTRLALQAARELPERFRDGVWLVELAPLSGADLIPQTVAVIFGLKEEATRSMWDTLPRFLRDRHLLLLLDGCEHVVQACAQFAENLLQTCPHVRILATSRENLGVASERAYYVPSLSIPAANAALSIKALASFESVRLFVERAALVAPNFAITNDNAAAVAQVCQRLDGIPLAIELAAARLRLLGIEQIALRLDDAFPLLTEGARTALPRHQTLQALFDWSYELLGAAEQTLLRRLAAFPGGWTLEAAEMAGAGDGVPMGEVVELLARLVGKSLALVEVQADLRRYRLLEPVRQYALAKLVAANELDAVRRRQAAFYLALIEASEAVHPTHLPVRSGGLGNLEQEHDNLRAALAWCQSAADGAELGLRLAGALDWFWFSRGLWSEAQGWLTGALKHPQAAHYPRALAQALESLGTIQVLRGDYAVGQDHLARSYRLFQELNDRPMMAWLLNRLGWVAREHGDAPAARKRLEESLALYRELQDEMGIAWSALTLGDTADAPAEAEWAMALLAESLTVFERRGVTLGVAWARNHLGHVAQLQGNYERAARLHEQSLPVFQQLGESLGVAWAQQGLGETALAHGDIQAAAKHFAASLDVFRNLGDRAGMAWCLAGIAAASANEKPAEAARLWGMAHALRQSIGARDAPVARVTHDRLMALAREQLGQATFDRQWTAGQTASVEDAIAQVLQS